MQPIAQPVVRCNGPEQDVKRLIDLKEKGFKGRWNFQPAFFIKNAPKNPILCLSVPAYRQAGKAGAKPSHFYRDFLRSVGWCGILCEGERY
jgi:hypothetical protein